MVFYVSVLKTDTPNKPYAIHLSKLKEKYRQKQRFQLFLKTYSEHPKEYYIDPLVKKGKPQTFYCKKAALKMVHKLAQEHGYFVRYPGDKWGIYKKIVKVRRKPPPNEKYVVQRIPEEELRDFVLKSINDYSPIDHVVKIMFERNIPVFSMATRKLGVCVLFNNSNNVKNTLMEESITRFEVYNKRRGVGGTDHSGNCHREQCIGDRIMDWDACFFQRKRIVNEICARLTKMYSKTPGSRMHTVDAVEAVEFDPSIKSAPVIKVI